MGETIVTARIYMFMLMTLAVGFVLQYFPLADFMSWFVPEWVLMVFIFWQLKLPGLINFWWVWPIGLLLDVQESLPLGTSVLGFAVVLYVLQLMYQRLKIFNAVQQAFVIFLLICCYQLITYWGLLIVSDSSQPLTLWVPSLVSILVWPWMYVALLSTYQKLR